MASDEARQAAQHQVVLRGIADRLDGEYGDLFTRDTLDHYVHDSYEELTARSKVLTHLPSFVERFAKQRMKALAKNRGLIEGHAPHILFVCERNDATSQMAAALFRAEVGDRAEVHSAGTAPTGELLDEAIHVLHEIGLEMIEEFPKPITDEIEEAADVIVSLGDHDVITVLDDRQFHAWRLPELDDQTVDTYRARRDDLRERVAELARTVVPAPTPQPHQAFDEDLADLDRRVEAMGIQAIEMWARLRPTLADPATVDPGGFEAMDDEVDRNDLALADRVVGVIARRQPVARDLRHVLASAQAGLHLERIADCATDAAALLAGDGLTTHEAVSAQLADMAGIVATMTERVLAALAARDADAARAVASLDDDLDRRREALFEELASARLDGVDRRSLLTLDHVSRLVQRAGDHAVEVAEEVVYLVTGERPELGRRTVTD